MSYLSSILDSIGNDGAAPSAPASAPTPRAPPAAQKRKADGELTNGPAKRSTTLANVQRNGVLQRPDAVGSAPITTAPKPKPAPLVTGGPYSGSAKAAATGIVKQSQVKAQTSSIAPVAVAKPVSKQAPISTKPTTPIADKPPPKKGSYADILARAKAAQASKPPVGVIMHKQAEKIDPKAARKVDAAKVKNGQRRDNKMGDRSRTGSAEETLRPGDKTKQQPKQRPKPLEKSNYKGSAQPTTPVYSGSARPGQTSRPAPKLYDGYAGTDEEIDEDEDDYGYDDDSDDMEAGAEDIWAEDEAALRQARKDDAAELAYETKLKRDKEARKKKALEELAASRKRR